MITASVDIRGMETVLSRIAVLTMRPMEEVTTAEALSILQTCLDRTELTPASKIKETVKTKFNQYSQSGRFGTRSEGSFPKVSICSRNGNIWLGVQRPSRGAFSRTRGRYGNGVWHLVNKHYERDEDWNLFQDMMKERIERMKKLTKEWLARRGMPRASWNFIAQELGATLRAAAVVLNATVRGRAMKEVGKASRKKSADGFSITMTNSSIASMKKDAAGILERTVAGRVKYFEKNLEKGVFDSMKNVERAYPNLVKVRAA